MEHLLLEKQAVCVSRADAVGEEAGLRWFKLVLMLCWSGQAGVQFIYLALHVTTS